MGLSVAGFNVGRSAMLSCDSLSVSARCKFSRGLEIQQSYKVSLTAIVKNNSALLQNCVNTKKISLVDRLKLRWWTGSQMTSDVCRSPDTPNVSDGDTA